MSKEELHEIFIKTVESFNFRHPVAEVVAKTGYNSGLVSEYLGSKKLVSEKFFKAFCTAFDLDYEKVVDIDVKPGKRKEVIPLGKHIPLRLKPEEYAEAFGDWKGLPMYNVPITASFVATYRDEKATPPYYYLHDPRFRDCDFGAVITGDSMHSEIRHGDMVACKEVTDWRFVVFGDIYYIVGTNGLETCKYLHPDREDRNNFLLVPRNESIPPSPLPKDMILKMYKVRGIIRGY